MASHGSEVELSPAEFAAWGGFLRAHARIRAVLDADLQRDHQLSENKYDVLLQLGRAGRHRLRVTELAQEVLMSPSGLSRLVDELERQGLVVRQRRDDDGRGFDVVLTGTGRTRLRAANRTHLKRVRELFLGRLTDAQLRQLSDIWSAIDPTLVPGHQQATPSPNRHSATSD